MEHIARALLYAAAFLEFSPDDVVEPGAAVKALEGIASELSLASPAELDVLRNVGKAEASHCANTPGYEQAAQFFENFLTHCGVDQE